jgi:hypothetical protein
MNLDSTFSPSCHSQTTALQQSTEMQIGHSDGSEAITVLLARPARTNAELTAVRQQSPGPRVTLCKG